MRKINIEVNEEFCQVKINGKEIDFTKMEYRLFIFLWRYKNLTCSRDLILDKVYGFNADIFSKVVDVYIWYIRNKLKDYGIDPSFIVTKRGFGYRMEI